MGRLANGIKRVAAIAMIALLPAAVGCGNFFQCEGKTSCGTSTSSDSGDIVFAANSGSSNLYAYYIGSGGSLNTVTGSPYTLPANATAMAVTPDDSLLYVANNLGGMTSYAVSSTGVLSNSTTANSSGVVETSMVISPDGQWLLELDLASTATPSLRVYQILTGGTLKGTTTGFIINSTAGYTVPSTATVTTYQVTISPDGKYVALAMGAAGDLVVPFTTASGTFGTPVFLSANGGGDNTVAFDNSTSHNLYIGRTTGVASTTGVVVYSVANNAYIPASSSPVPYATGAGPRSLAFANSYGSLFSANISDGTITSNLVSSSQVLTQVGTAVTAPTGVQQLAVDSTGKYLLAAGTNATTGLQIFTINSSGSLTSVGTAALSTSNSVPVLAVTH